MGGHGAVCGGPFQQRFTPICDFHRLQPPRNYYVLVLQLQLCGAPQGMDLTTDKLRSLLKKWQTTIEAFVDVKTQDGYVLRLFCIAFTHKREPQIKKSSYA